MQIAGIMVTNNGGHPPEKWADLTTDTILNLMVDANPEDASERSIAARRVKREVGVKLFDIFNKHHAAVMVSEKDHLKKDARKRLAAVAQTGLDPSPHMSTMDQVFAALAETPWKDHFAKPEVRRVLRDIVGQHTADVMHHEHRYHADRVAKAAKGD